MTTWSRLHAAAGATDPEDRTPSSPRTRTPEAASERSSAITRLPTGSRATGASAVEPKSLRFASPRHAPRGVLLGRHTTRYPSLVGLAMHTPERRQAQRNLGSTTLVGAVPARLLPG